MTFSTSLTETGGTPVAIADLSPDFEDYAKKMTMF
jgi:hypothetical protein